MNRTAGVHLVCEALVIIALVVDVIVGIVVSLVALQGDGGVADVVAWRALFTALTALCVVWYAVYAWASRYWDECHYNAYRMYIWSAMAGHAAIALLVWVDTTRPVLVVYVPLALVRFVGHGLEVVRTWWSPWSTPLTTTTTDAHNRVHRALQSGYIYNHPLSIDATAATATLTLPPPMTRRPLTRLERLAAGRVQ